jgi:hypothetical protein
VFHALPETAQKELVPVLRALTTVKGGKATARSAPLANFPPGSPRRVLVDVSLQSQARLLVADGDDAGAQVRLSHEALLTHWPRARDQFTADARDLELRGRLEQEAELWRAASRRDKAGRVRASGLPLAEALALCGPLARRFTAAETFGSIHGKSVRRTALQSIKLLVCAISASGSSEQLPLEDPQRSCTHQTNTSATSACEEGRTSAAKLARTCASSLKRDAATPMKSWPPPHRAAGAVPAWHVQLARQHRLG